MANLNGQTIRGTNNYKGLLNLDSTIGTPLDATLRAVTDGAGTASLLQLSTEAVGLSRTVNLSAGATTPRLFNVAYTINNSGAQTGTATGLFLNATETALNGMTHNLLDLQVGGVSRFKVRNDGAILSNGSIFCGSSLQFGGGSSATITSVTSANLLLRDGLTGLTFGLLQLGGTTSSFPSIKRNGAAIDFRLADDSAYCNINAQNIISNNARFQGSNSFVIQSAVDGRIVLQNNATTNFDLLQFGGTTNAFPAIKRNGAAIDFRLADDSAPCAISTSFINVVNVGSIAFFSNTINTRLQIANGVGSNSIVLQVRNGDDGLNRDFYIDALNVYLQKTSLGSVSIGTDVINASAVFQINSTTKGFLMPRMTQAQILAIATPANGLQVYNTDLAQPCFYDGAGWRKVSHSVM